MLLILKDTISLNEVKPHSFLDNMTLNEVHEENQNSQNIDVLCI